MVSFVLIHVLYECIHMWIKIDSEQTKMLMFSIDCKTGFLVQTGLSVLKVLKPVPDFGFHIIGLIHTQCLCL